ncbi:hypothetical protein C8R43DRAFT_964089 [Mycena crocata]|nr:hypothetical protein C8R43DRAFT_964089 [Mycena crocata]
MFSLADSSPGTQYSVNATLFEWWWKSLIEALSATCLLRLYSVGFTLIGDLIMALNKQVYMLMSIETANASRNTSFVTDLVFLYRCYMIWGSRKKVLFLPGISMLATLVAECVSIGGIYAGLFHPNPTYLDPRIPAILGGVTNIILVGFTAGRIWYIRREAQICIPNTFRQRYDTAIIIILESGAIYVFCLIIWVTAESLIMHSDSSGVIIFQGVAQGLVLQAVNIVPTLILVRVGLGRSTEKNSPFSQELPALHQVPLISVARLGKSSSLPDPVQKESGAGVLHISPEE